MTILKPMPWRPAPVRGRTWTTPARRTTAAALQMASGALARWAVHVALPISEAAARSALPSVVEFHAEAGAPEGALYIDGELVGWLSGIRRL